MNKKNFLKNIWYIGDRPYYYFETYYVTLGYISIKEAYSRMIACCNNSVCKFFVDETKKDSQKKLWQKAIKNPKWIDEIIMLFKKNKEKLIQEFELLKVKDLSEKELFAAYKKYVNYYYFFQKEGNSIARLLDRFGIEILREQLQRARVRDVENIITVLTFPHQESYLAREERIFWQGIAKINSKNQIDSFIEDHLKKYAYVGRSYFDEKPLTKKDFLKRLLGLPIKKWSLKAKKIRELRRKNIAEFNKMIKNSKISPPIKKSALILRKAAFLKDYIGGCLTEVYFYGEKIFNELSRRTGLKVEEIKSFIPKEFENVFLRNKKIDRRVILKRMKGVYATLPLGKGVKVIYNKSVISFEKKYLLKKEQKHKTEFIGRPVSPGRLRGSVRVVNNPQEAKNLKRGEILVVNNTNPALVPYLKRVKGIIAEEGGVGAHVAIISREMKIPCVTGIAYAREIFKTGEKIEVDANKGIIRKIK